MELREKIVELKNGNALADPQRDPVEEANAYRDSIPEDDGDELSLARGEIAWLREAVRRSETATITIEQQAALKDADDGYAGYVDAFYELADMMDIGARPHSPKVTWEREMKPRLLAMFDRRIP